MELLIILKETFNKRNKEHKFKKFKKFKNNNNLTLRQDLLNNKTFNYNNKYKNNKIKLTVNS